LIHRDLFLNFESGKERESNSWIKKKEYQHSHWGGGGKKHFLVLKTGRGYRRILGKKGRGKLRPKPHRGRISTVEKRGPQRSWSRGNQRFGGFFRTNRQGFVQQTTRDAKLPRVKSKRETDRFVTGNREKKKEGR